MTGTVLVDTGPLVALLNRGERQHEWVKARVGEVAPPLLTCEAVLAETAFLLRKLDPGAGTLMALLERRALQVAFHLDDHQDAVTRLMTRYADLPMSLADACLVRMTEVHPRCLLLTFDSDFRVYRRHGRQAIPTLTPPGL